MKLTVERQEANIYRAMLNGQSVMGYTVAPHSPVTKTEPWLSDASWGGPLFLECHRMGIRLL